MNGAIVVDIQGDFTQLMSWFFGRTGNRFGLFE